MSVEALEAPAGVEETPLTTETPAAPEGVAPSAPADEAAITEPAASLSARPRGPDGRFIKADGTQASDVEHAAMEAAAVASPPPAATTPQTPLAPPEPFTFRADGQRFPIPGSAVSADGHLTIPADQVPAVRQLLAEGVAHRGSWRQREQDYQRQITEASAVQTARANKYHDAAVLMHEKLSDPDWLAAAVADPRELAFLNREVGFLLKERDLQAPRVTEAPRADPAQQERQLEAAAKQTLSEYVEELLETPQAKAVYATPEDREKVKARYERRLGAYFVERNGGLALSLDTVDADFSEEIEQRKANQKAAVDSKKAEDFNARRNVPAANAPPVVSTKGPGGNGQTGGRVFKTREEYQKAMGIG